MIEKNKTNDLDMIKNVLDSLKMYINQEMFLKELEYRGEYVDESKKVNTEFEQHSMTAKLYGKPRVSKTMEKAIKQSEENKKKPSDRVIHVNSLDDFLDGKEQPYETKAPKVAETNEEPIDPKKFKEMLKKQMDKDDNDDTLG